MSIFRNLPETSSANRSEFPLEILERSGYNSKVLSGNLSAVT